MRIPRKILRKGLVSIAALLCVLCIYWLWRMNRYNRIISEEAASFGLEPRLVRCVVAQESGFRRAIRGAAGEIGLMQIMPVVGEEYARAHGRHDFQAQDLFRPRINIRVGCWYLSRMMERYGEYRDKVSLSLAAYNAGAGRVDGWIRKSGFDKGSADFVRHIQIPSTRMYVKQILKRSGR